MLIRFIVSNFLSFYEETEFNMLAGDFRTHKSHVYQVDKLDVLKSAAIYGANGAGKSNLIKAIDFVQRLLASGGLSRSVNDKKFRLDAQAAGKPTTFEIEFSIGKQVYAYGLSLSDTIVVEEWLVASGITKDDKVIFERKTLEDGRISLDFDAKYKKTAKQKLLLELLAENLLQPHQLVLSKVEELKIDVLKEVSDWIQHQLVIIYPGSRFKQLVPLLDTPKFQLFANSLLTALDTGVSELSVERMELAEFVGENEQLRERIEQQMIGKSIMPFDRNGNFVFVLRQQDGYWVYKPITKHLSREGMDVPFDLEEESDGTRRLLDIIPVFAFILEQEMTFVIDEIGQSIHPGLLKALVEKIMADDTRGQIIFTTHEASLLDMDVFRQDEIWFAEKNRKQGSTHLYSLSEYKPRTDLDIQKGYLKGRFGAIPFLANLQDLNWQQHDKA